MNEADDVLLVVAPEAGGTEPEAVEAAAAVLGGHGRVHRVDPAGEDELRHALATAARRLLVVAGGDGTLHLVLTILDQQGLAGSCPIAVIPLGTGNDFARGAGVPLTPTEAAQVAVSGQPRPADLVCGDDGTVVVNAVHLGVGAEAADRASTLKPLLGRTAYRLAAAMSGVQLPSWEVTVEVDGARLSEGPSHLVAVCNGSTIGGGTWLRPRASPFDGVVDVLSVAAPAGLVERAELAAAVRGGRLAEDPAVAVARGRTVTLAGQALPPVADGELGEARPDRTYRLRAGAWTVMIPADGG